MPTDLIERRLAAILAADMVGFSRLMEADEAGTLSRLKALRTELIDPKIAEHRGRIVKTTGDGLLVEFVSVADAVQTAVEIQKAMAERNATVPEEKRIQFRIGVNLGEIIIEDGDIYGTGVNVATRLETLAQPGGICISGSVYEQIENILSLKYEDLGEQQVKNIAKPVHGYAIRADQPIQLDDLAGGPKDKKKDESKPSIAVLPFANMSADPEQEFFADGMTEDIITALSKISGLLVIARNSTFTYKGKAVDVRRVAHELDVHYVLEGSVRKSGNKVRITTQVVDSKTGDHLWGARFDRDLDDLFAVQDEITANIVTALQVRLVEGEQARVWSRSTKDLGAWECLIQGQDRFRRYARQDNAKARSLFKKAAELDPDYAMAWVRIGWTHWADARYLWSDSPSSSIAAADEMAEKALALDDQLAEAQALCGAIALMRRDFDEAVAAGERAVALDPNGADVTALLAMTLNWSGRPEKALVLIDKAKRLSPLYSSWYLAVEAHSLRLLERHDEAIAIYRASIERNPDHIASRIGLTSSLAETGQLDEARAQAQELLRISPGFTIGKYAESLTYKDPAHAERSLTALRSVGLPE
ncbi:MAG TPA: tetratricopeptide repeat protein [Kiloniellales bacterium]|nr:tetratricopeptide repeat protein [Kiloniellales bacterium]